MAEQPWIDFGEFCGYLVASGLMHPKHMRAVLVESAIAEYPDPLSDLINHLLRRNMLTEWQVAKLRNRQYKGFFLDHYVIRDVAESGENFKRFVAHDLRTKQSLILYVKPREQLNPGEPEYWIEPSSGDR